MLRSVGLSLLIACVAACSSGSDDSADDTTVAEAPLTTIRLEVAASSKLPLKEVSGLGVRKINGKKNYLAIGDNASTLVTFDLDANGKVKSPKSVPVPGAGRPSQFEAVAGDGSGKVFVLNEGEGKITVLKDNLESIAHTYELTIPEDHDLYSAWDRDENSRAEGMVLLKNGHILIAKEKGPAALIEFAKEGSAPEGFKADLALGDRAFAVPDRNGTTKLVPVAYWELKATAARVIGDISDIAVDGEGRLIVLTDQGRAIVRIERELSPEESKIEAKDVFELPRAVDKPEGLVFADGKPLVAIDNQDDGIDTIFSFGALPSGN